MTDRPHFLNVAYSGSGLTTMDYERKMVREKDVKFDNENGSIELTDVRLVWIKAPKKSSGLKRFGALAGAIAGAALLEGAGRQMGGIGGSLLRSAGRGIGYAAVGTAISTWTRDSYFNKDANGNTESLALPIAAISQATQSGNRLIVELKSGGTMEFEFKQKKVIPSVVANLSQAQSEGKCPYCGAGAATYMAECPRCGAPLGGSGVPPTGASGGAAHVTGQPGQVHIDVKGQGGGGPESMHITYGEDRDGDGRPDSVSISYSGQPGSGGGGGGFCPNCGQSLPAGAKFCNNCGHKVA
ncbi:MAG: hypothetical protein DRP09_10000 [Candidatus Thorarchaeota archaeon]|nr:MAG: hypothetical protein DRP09_10000 [Candidatus Thorarchaeota archaeon]